MTSTKGGSYHVKKIHLKSLLDNRELRMIFVREEDYHMKKTYI